MIGIVVRGYITKFRKEEQWEEDLEEANLEDLRSDADAVPFYIEGKDGRYYEYYGYNISINKQIYVVKGTY